MYSECTLLDVQYQYTLRDDVSGGVECKNALRWFILAHQLTACGNEKARIYCNTFAPTSFYKCRKEIKIFVAHFDRVIFYELNITVLLYSVLQPYN